MRLFFFFFFQQGGSQYVNVNKHSITSFNYVLYIDNPGNDTFLNFFFFFFFFYISGGYANWFFFEYGISASQFTIYKVKSLCYFSSLIMWKTDCFFNGQHKVLNKFKLIIKEKHQNVFNGKTELERERD